MCRDPLNSQIRGLSQGYGSPLYAMDWGVCRGVSACVRECICVRRRERERENDVCRRTRTGLGLDGGGLVLPTLSKLWGSIRVCLKSRE